LIEINPIKTITSRHKQIKVSELNCLDLKFIAVIHYFLAYLPDEYDDRREEEAQRKGIT
jgi:hypothetical protein